MLMILFYGLAAKQNNDASHIGCFCIDQKLYEVHFQFSKDLKMSATKQSVHTIADCFITNKEKFLIYGEYCSNLLSAQEQLDNLCNTMPNVQSLVTVCDVCY